MKILVFVKKKKKRNNSETQNSERYNIFIYFVKTLLIKQQTMYLNNKSIREQLKKKKTLKTYINNYCRKKKRIITLTFPNK